jgi:Holliday junction DNA helicase RuvB
MEDFALDVVLGKGPGARTVRLQIEPVTVIGATTRVGSITGPLRDRFGVDVSARLLHPRPSWSGSSALGRDPRRSA